MRRYHQNGLRSSRKRPSTPPSVFGKALIHGVHLREEQKAVGGGLEVEMSPRRLDATALRDWAHTAVDHLIAHTDEINRLNVFPVADADTGTNMLFTMRAACACADADSDSDDVTVVAAALAAGALHGARGNSGVILSPIFRG